MTILPIDQDGLAEATAALRRGDAVLIPFPTPLPYAVAAVEAATVNRAKGRPVDQPCGILLHGMEDILAFLDLDDETIRLAIWITEVEKANLLLPILSHAPQWLGSAAADGRVGITLACLPQLRPLLESVGHLFVSSGNRTGEPVAATATEVHGMFGGRQLVLDGDRFRDPEIAHGSATIVEVRRAGELRVARDGINNARASLADHTAYLDTLRDRFTQDHSETANSASAHGRRTGEAGRRPR